MSTKHLSPELLSERRLEAVRLRLDGHTVAEVARQTGLSSPTVSAAWKAFREGGWEAVPVRPRGRKAGQAARLDATALRALIECLRDLPESPESHEPAWSSRALAEGLRQQGHEVSPRAIEHWLAAQDLKPEPIGLEALERQRGQAGRWVRQQVQPVFDEVRKAGGLVWQGGVRIAKPAQPSPEMPRYQLYLHGKRGLLYTRCLFSPPRANDYLTLFTRLVERGPVAVIFHGADFQASPEIRRWLEQNPQMHLMTVPGDALTR